MKEIKLKLIHELAKNSRRSDRELAKIIGISQPRVNRIIRKLKKEGYIQEYTMIPNFEKIGYKILAFTIAKARVTLSPSEQEMAKKELLAKSQVIFVASGVGMGKNGILISLHKDYSDFKIFMDNLKFETGGFMESVETMLVSLDSPSIIKPLSFAGAI